MSTRRSYGTGSLYVHTDGNGAEAWYGRWRVNGRRVNRLIGPKRTPGTRDGLTRAQAEARMRELIADVKATPRARGGLTLADVAARYQRHQQAQGLKRTTLAATESTCRIWLVPHLGDKPLDRIRPEDVEDLMAAMAARGVGPKSIRNYVGTLSAIFKFAMHTRRRWATVNPCESVDLPPKPKTKRNGAIKFYTPDEVRALAGRAVPGEHQAIDRALYLTAAMTGLRQGELLGLRVQDIDWKARRVRVEQTHVLGEFDTPKSECGFRSVPLPDEVGGVLNDLSKTTGSTEDDDLVFVEPGTRVPLRRGALMRRYRRAQKAALLPPLNFHALRHTFATTMAAHGVSMHTLQEWMGHEDPATTAIYKHYAPNAHEVELVNAAFGSVDHDGYGAPHVRGSA